MTRDSSSVVLNGELSDHSRSGPDTSNEVGVARRASRA